MILIYGADWSHSHRTWENPKLLWRHSAPGWKIPKGVQEIFIYSQFRPDWSAKIREQAKKQGVRVVEFETTPELLEYLNHRFSLGIRSGLVGVLGSLEYLEQELNKLMAELRLIGDMLPVTVSRS